MTDEIPCVEHAQQLDALKQDHIKTQQLLERVGSMVEQVNTALIGSINGSQRGILPRLVQLEGDWRRWEDDQRWYRRAVISSVIGVLVATCVAGIAVLK